MNLKSVVIAVAGAGVLAFALYLFIQVRSTPAQARATQVTARPPAPAHEPAPATTPTPPPSTAPTKVKLPSNLASDLTDVSNRPQLGREVNGPPAPTQTDELKAGMKLDNMMELANKAYDGQNFDEATAIAQKVLSKDPNNVRMLRIVVSANCIQGDSAIAQQAYEKLPAADREQMRTRCDRYGVSFKEPSP